MHWRQEESRLRAVVDTAVDGVILIDAAGIILMFNPACENMFGYASFEVVGRNVKMLMPEPYRHEHDGYLGNYRETGEKKIIGIGREVLGRKRNGSTFPMDLSVGEATEDGKPIFVGIIRDLTERKAAESALREKTAQLQALVDTAVDGVILIDASGRVLMFNPACEKLFGYSASSVIGRNVKMLMPEPYQHEHDSYLGNYRETGEKKIIGIGREVLGRTRDGGTFPMELSVGEAKHENGDSIFVGVIHDISARKAVQEQLAQAQKMEIVGQLSGGIAHDFNNLLTVILGNAEALSLRLKSREDLRSLSDTIMNAAERGAEMTQRLLAFSRRQVLQPIAVDCNALMENMRLLLRRMLREDVDLKVSLSPTPVTAQADPSQLESAVLNLALNAQDAMPSGGVLTLATAEVELDEFALSGNTDAKPGIYVMVSVTDDGQGMTPDVVARAFEPFFTTKDVGKGSGLGLSMVYGFIKQSSGHVTIYSEPGLGTTVRLFIPLAETGAPVETRRPGGDETPRGAETLLVVEDDPFVRSHVISSLERLGYRIIVAENGRDALGLLQAGARPALMFTDIVMPGGLSGWELVAEARRLMPTLKVLYTSGYPQETLASRRALDQHATILTKPYRLAELAQQVRAKLDS